MKRKIVLTGVIALILICSQIAASAGDKTLFIKGSNITRAGSLLTTNQILFYKGGTLTSLYVPGTSTVITDFQIAAGKVDDKGSTAGRNVQVSCNVGDNLLAVVWTPATGAGNYYATTGLAMSQANYDNSTLTWTWDGMAVDYKAAAPYKPSISNFAETRNTDTKDTTSTADDTSSSSLVVTSKAGAGTDGLREVTGYSWMMWEATAVQPAVGTPGGASLSVDSASLKSDTIYSFRVNHSNQWDSAGTWSDTYNYKIGGATPGGLVEVIIDLTKVAGGLGVNSIGIPFAPPFELQKKNADGSFTSVATGITTLADLVGALNSAGVKASAASYWDSTQKLLGATYNTDGAQTYTTAGFIPANLNLEAGKGYYVSVSDNITIKLKK